VVGHSGIRRKPASLPVQRRLVKVAKNVGINHPPELMDLVHVTNAGRGRRIVFGEKIEARRCKVFDRDLVYLFMGRPAFRFQDGDEKTDQISRFPVVFVVSPEKLGEPHHIYPLDTGAAVKGIYENAVDREVFLEDYELDPEINAALRHVAWAFGSKQAYFRGQLKVGLADSLPHWESAARSWISIASSPCEGADKPDDRASAVEVAYSRHIELRENLRLIVVPQQLLEDPRGNDEELIVKLKELSPNLRLYDWRPNETPDSYMVEITSIVRQYLEDDGQL
jgi:hypothetical protein